MCGVRCAVFGVLYAHKPFKKMITLIKIDTEFSLVVCGCACASIRGGNNYMTGWIYRLAG